MPRRAFCLLPLLAVAAPDAQAQWTVGLTAGVERVSGFAESLDPEQAGLRVRPTMAWPLSLRVVRGGNGVRVGLRASRVGSGLELDDGSLAVALRPAFRTLTLAPEASVPVAALHGGGQLRLAAALPFERWSFPTVDETARWKAGVAAGIEVELPLRPSLSFQVSAEVGRLFGSPIAETEMTQEYLPAPLWRRSLRAGLGWRIR